MLLRMSLSLPAGFLLGHVIAQLLDSNQAHLSYEVFAAAVLIGFRLAIDEWAL